jgi:hypothetical protein
LILYLQDAKDSTKKSGLINSFGNVAGYKTNIQNSVAFLVDTNNEKAEKEIQIIIPFTIG